MSAHGAEEPTPDAVVRPRRPSLVEQARAKGTPPIGDGSAYADPELFTDPGELEEFLAFVRESRHASTQ